MEKILNLIDGQMVAPQGGEFLDNFNPATGRVYSKVASSDERDVEKAVESARHAARAWGRTSIRERADILLKIAQLIEKNVDDLARAESVDSGKPLSLARKLEIPRSASNFRFFAEAVGQFHGDQFQTTQTIFNYTEATPMGVAGCISPWNLPLYLFTWKIAPALAAGNAVVAKPSELTPMTAYLLGKIAVAAGLPPGVLNIVQGTGPKVGEAIVRHSQVKAVSFTGSTGVGRRIAEICGTQLKKVSLELGGKNANIIFSDAPMDKALATTVRSTFQNQGQICLCGSRILIHKDIYETFKNRLIEQVKFMRVGDPLAEDTDQGALVSREHMQKVLGYIERARTDGGKVLCGGETANVGGEFTDGYFVQPTLIEGLDEKAAINQEEVFGPVATLIPFSSMEDAVGIANSTPYGLACSIWTKDLKGAHQTARMIQSGLVWINTWMTRDLRTPFGGVKQSGVGREGGFEALKFFSETKNICLDTDYGD